MRLFSFILLLEGLTQVAFPHSGIPIQKGDIRIGRQERITTTISEPRQDPLVLYFLKRIQKYFTESCMLISWETGLG